MAARSVVRLAVVVAKGSLEVARVNKARSLGALNTLSAEIRRRDQIQFLSEFTCIRSLNGFASHVVVVPVGHSVSVERICITDF